MGHEGDKSNKVLTFFIILSIIVILIVLYLAFTSEQQQFTTQHKPQYTDIFIPSKNNLSEVLSNDGGLDELRAASSEYLKTSTNWINEVFSYTTWRLAVLFSIVFALIFTAIMSSLVMYSKNICNEQLILAVFLVMSIGMILCTYVSLNFFGRHIVKPAEDISE